MFNVLGKTADILEREADMIIYGDMRVEKGADGGAVVNRKLLFRSDGNISCGTRFRNFPSEIESDAGVFVNTFKEAILSLYDGDKSAVKEAQKEQVAIAEAKAERAIEADKRTPDKYHQAIDELIKEMPKETKKDVAKKFKEIFNGDANYKNADNVDELQEALDFLKSL